MGFCGIWRAGVRSRSSLCSAAFATTWFVEHKWQNSAGLTVAADWRLCRLCAAAWDWCLLRISGSAPAKHVRRIGALRL